MLSGVTAARGHSALSSRRPPKVTTSPEVERRSRSHDRLATHGKLSVRTTGYPIRTSEAGRGSIRDLFFFSRRRRHTRSLRDWSSDVCSSDLADALVAAGAEGPAAVLGGRPVAGEQHAADVRGLAGVVERAVELVDGARAEGVAHLRAVEDRKSVV